MTAAALDFGDFASDAQRARGAARRRREGPRVLPPTPIRLDRIGRTLDGTLRLDAARLLSAGHSPFRSLHTVVRLDRRRLTAAPLRVGLSSGTLTGRVVVDHRGDRPALALDLRVAGARIERLLLPGGAIEGPLAARIRLDGRGDTIRAALAGSAGRLGLVVPRGSIRRDYAIFVGGDVFKTIGALIGDARDRRIPVRCVIGNFRAARGRLLPHPLLLDTSITRADGAGAITLADERIDLLLRGQAKKPGLLQSTAPTRIFGTLADPQVDIRPPRAAGQGKSGLLDRIGFLFKGMRTRGDAGRNVPPSDADCARLARAALR